MRPAVFLDRDGTIAEDVHYCRRPEDFHLLPRAADAIALLNRADLPVVVVTNQSGIARGYFTWGTLAAIHATMHAGLAAGRAQVTGVYVCPHHPDDGCECRKPRPGLLHRASADLDLDLSRSYVVGDRAMDIQVARACGCRAILVDTGPPDARERAADAGPPDCHAKDLYEATLWILEDRRGL